MSLISSLVNEKLLPLTNKPCLVSLSAPEELSPNSNLSVWMTFEISPAVRGVANDVPHEHNAVFFTGGIGIELRFGRDSLCVWDLNTLTTTIKLPMVKRAAYVVAFDCAAMTKMCAQVGTIRVDDMRLAIFASIHDKLLTQILYRLHFTGGQIFGFGHPEPTERHGKRNSLTHIK